MNLPPTSIDELLARANALVGMAVDGILRDLDLIASTNPLRTKGSAGETLERALSATDGSSQILDFPDLDVELKTIPITADGTPLESTYVCTISIANADSQE